MVVLQRTMLGTSLTLLTALIACGGAENSNLASLESQGKKTKGDDDKNIGLSNGSNSGYSAAENPWFISNRDGSEVTGRPESATELKNSYRPSGMDQFLSSFVSIEDKDSTQRCSGTRILEGTSIYILTAAHCFAKYDKIGRKILGADRPINFSIVNYSPFVHTIPTTNRVYKLDENSRTDYSGKPVFQLGQGDVIKVLIEKNVDPRLWTDKSAPLCSSAAVNDSTRTSTKARLMLGSRKWKDINFEILLYRPMYQGQARMGGYGAGILNGDGIYNLRPDIIDFISKSALVFNSTEPKYNTASAMNQIRAGAIPQKIEESQGLYSFTDLASSSGIGAGDSGLPIIEGEQSAKNLPTWVGSNVTIPVPLFNRLNCVSGVVVREYWDNPYGSAGGGFESGQEFRSNGGIGTRVSSTAIVQRISTLDASKWRQVYPLPSDARAFTVFATAGQESYTRDIVASTSKADEAKQMHCLSMLEKFVKPASFTGIQKIRCDLLNRETKVRVGNSEFYDLPQGFGR